MPGVEAVRAICLLNLFWLSSRGGKHLNAAVQFNATVASAVWEIDLVRSVFSSTITRQTELC